VSACEKWVSDHLDAGDVTCPHDKDHALALEARVAAKRGGWSPLQVRKEGSGLRHYLDGQPVHCGTGLELQVIEYKSDDYGEFTVFRNEGRRVRYEASQDGKTIRATLHVGVAGHEFVAASESYMRFRWPVRS